MKKRLGDMLREAQDVLASDFSDDDLVKSLNFWAKFLKDASEKCEIAAADVNNIEALEEANNIMDLALSYSRTRYLIAKMIGIKRKKYPKGEDID